MANYGNFVYSQVYAEDLTQQLNGTVKIYPSRFIAFKKSNGLPKLMTNLEYTKEGAMNLKRTHAIGSLYYENNTDIRSGYTWNQYENAQKAQGIQHAYWGDIVCSGDINFLASDVKNGLSTSEVTIYVNGGDALQRHALFPNMFATGAESIWYRKLQEVNFDYMQSNQSPEPIIENNQITFDSILLLYNVYGDTQSSVEPALLMKDIPMGVWTIKQGQPKVTLDVNDEQNFNISTTFSIRLNFAISTISNTPSVSISNGSDEYNMAVIMNNLAECMKTMNQIVKTNANALMEAKAYFTDFANKRHVNVPYLIDGRWYVNGRYIGGESNGGTGGSGNCNCGPLGDAGSFERYKNEVNNQ